VFAKITQSQWLRILHVFQERRHQNYTWEENQLKESDSSCNILKTIMFCVLFLPTESWKFLTYITFSLFMVGNWS
jgi:hypothetical protein